MLFEVFFFLKHLSGQNMNVWNVLILEWVSSQLGFEFEFTVDVFNFQYEERNHGRHLQIAASASRESSGSKAS